MQCWRLSCLLPAIFLLSYAAAEQQKTQTLPVLKSPAVSGGSPGCLSDSPTAEEIQAVLDTHNTLRNVVGAANMQHMTWNQSIAEKAEELAATCVFAHAMLEWEGSPYERVGQNLYLGFNSDYGNAVNAWHDYEVESYDYENDICNDDVATCGHYTQIVWGDTREVGCGRHYCLTATDPDNGFEYSNVYIIACNYGPRGNVAGRKPYLEGEPCSKCAGGSSMCNDGLCDDDCEGPHCSCNVDCHGHGMEQLDDCTCVCDEGWYGAQCTEECVERHANCGRANGWPEGFCRFDFVSDRCPVLCGHCTPLGGPPCIDQHAYCNNGWPESWCTLPNVPFVAQLCNAMCDTCPE